MSATRLTLRLISLLLLCALFLSTAQPGAAQDGVTPEWLSPVEWESIQVQIAASDWFGNDVGVDGDHILVGASHNDILANSNQGSVYWFWRNYGGADTWGQISRILLPHGAADEEFGTVVALEQDLLAVGAPGAQTSFSNGIGAAHLFLQMLPHELFLPLIRR